MAKVQVASCGQLSFGRWKQRPIAQNPRYDSVTRSTLTRESTPDSQDARVALLEENPALLWFECFKLNQFLQRTYSNNQKALGNDCWWSTSVVIQKCKLKLQSIRSQFIPTKMAIIEQQVLGLTGTIQTPPTLLVGKRMQVLWKLVWGSL